MKVHKIISGVTNYRRLGLAMALVLLLAIPFLLGNPYYTHILVLVLVYVLLALGLNVIISAGMLNLGYIAFYAVGAYSYAILNSRFHVSFWAVMPIAISLSAICGLILAFVSLRSHGDYFAIATLGFGEIVRLALRNSDSLTHGPKGIMGISKPVLFVNITKPIHFYFLILSVTIVVFYVVHRLMVSKIGAGWIALRESETWAKTTGYHVLALKLAACITGAIIAGITGVFFAGWQTFVAPKSFIFLESVLVLCMVVLGAGIRGNLLGVMLGAAILTILPELLREFNQYRMLALGAGMTAIVVLRGGGLVNRDWGKGYDRKLFRHGVADHDGDQIIPTGKRQENHAESAALSIRNLSKHYGGTKALDGFTFEFEKGKIYGIMGFNGAGKTTLFNCLRGIVTPDSGEIEVLGEVIFSEGKQKSVPARLIAKNISTTFQKCILIDSMQAWKNVYLAVQPLPTGKHVWKETALSLLGGFHDSDIEAKDKAITTLTDTMGFAEEELEKPVSEFSLGMRRKVELAKALVMEAPIVLLDEPTSGLNDYEKERFVEIIKRLRDDRAIIVIEHNYRMLEDIADEVLFFKDGNIATDTEGKPIVGSYQYVINNEVVKHDYIGACEVSHGGTETASTPVALEVKIERAGYQSGQQILRDLNLSVPRGSIAVIHGRNGSGKSTLLKCIMNSDELALIDGSVTLKRQAERDLELLKLRTYQIAREAISLVPQWNNLFDTMSVDENLRYATFYRKDSPSNIEKDVSFFYEEILGPTLYKAKSKQVQYLSGGQKQMVAIGRALVATPLITSSGTKDKGERILLFDEPTAGLQPSAANMIIDAIGDINREFGYTVIIVEQNTEVDRIAHECYEVVGGTIEQL